MDINLRQWADSLRDEAEHDFTAGVMVQVVDAYLYDEDRRRKGVAADIDELWDLKSAVRVASALLDGLAETEWADMRGWRYMQSPRNDVQTFYSAIYTLALQLGDSIAHVERDTFPRLKPLFDAERAEYQRRCEEVTQEEIFELAGCADTGKAR